MTLVLCDITDQYDKDKLPLALLAIFMLAFIAIVIPYLKERFKINQIDRPSARGIPYFFISSPTRRPGTWRAS